MARASSLRWIPLGLAACLVARAAVGCGTASLVDSTATDAGTTRRDAAPVAPYDSGPALDGGAAPAPSCDAYCSLVMTNCTDANAQYRTTAECLAFCRDLTLDVPVTEAETKSAPTVACRQYWADAPARTSPDEYCLAAGPFGGARCGSRCTAYCDAVLAACGSFQQGALAPYPGGPSCETACAAFDYRDASVDGGGEGPDGPDSGDSFNCRLYWLRLAVVDPTQCSALAPDAGACHE